MEMYNVTKYQVNSLKINLEKLKWNEFSRFTSQKFVPTKIEQMCLPQITNKDSMLKSRRLRVFGYN